MECHLHCYTKYSTVVNYVFVSGFNCTFTAGLQSSACEQPLCEAEFPDKCQVAYFTLLRRRDLIPLEVGMTLRWQIGNNSRALAFRVPPVLEDVPCVLP